MKHIMIMLFLGATTMVAAQSINQKQVFIEATSLADQYNMSDEQKQELKKVIEKKYQDLNNIIGFREEAPKTYHQKRKAIYDGMENSIQSIMTKEQLEDYKINQENSKMKRGKNLSKLSSKSMTKQLSTSATKELPLEGGN